MALIALGDPQFGAALVNEAQIDGVDLALEHLLTVDEHGDEVMRERHGHLVPLAVGYLHGKCL